jgi:SAM-dependent methyltransferase
MQAALDAEAAAVRSDFDRLAALEEEGWSGNNHYHGFLLRQLPSHIDAALDVGCGSGAFARQLAPRATSVVGLDFSPEMVRVARERSRAFANITYQVADVRGWDWPAAAFDCVASIATVHHLPLAETLVQMRDALRPGGALLILDLFEAATVKEKSIAACGFPVRVALRLTNKGRLRDTPEVRAAWDAHGRHDHYLQLAKVQQTCDRIIPGARVRQHLMWRYSLVWRKPDHPQ